MPTSLAAPLEGRRCLRAGPVVAKQTQCIKRLPERPALSTGVLEAPALCLALG